MCQEDNRIYCWYQRSDLNRFRRETADIVHTTPLNYQQNLTNAFGSCTEASSEPNLNNSVLSVSEFERLEHWMVSASDRIGLEKWSIARVANDKTMRRRALNQVIIAQQHEGESEYLREACARVSRPSRLFARTLAEALAAAVQTGCDPQNNSQ